VRNTLITTGTRNGGRPVSGNKSSKRVLNIVNLKYPWLKENVAAKSMSSKLNLIKDGPLWGSTPFLSEVSQKLYINPARAIIS